MFSCVLYPLGIRSQQPTVLTLSLCLSGQTEGLTIPYCTIYLTMDQFKKYEFTIKVKTNHDPRQAIFEIVNALKGMLPVLSIEHRLIEDRATNDEHHGGIQDDDT